MKSLGTRSTWSFHHALVRGFRKQSGREFIYLIRDTGKFILLQNEVRAKRARKAGSEREGSKAALQMVISPASLLDAQSADSGGKSRLLLEQDERILRRGGEFMLNFIKFLAEERGQRDLKGLIWSHRLFLFDYQLLMKALNWSLFNMTAGEVGLSGV